MRNFRFTVRYDGTAFQGWQSQPGLRTVQETFEAAFAAVTQDPRPRANPSGRTDAGVHALGQVVNVYSPTRHPPEVLVKALNAKLPPDVAVAAGDVAAESFCANKDAVTKTYRYVIHAARARDPFARAYSHHCRQPLDADAMHAGAQFLLGRHDFRSFETNYPNRLSSVRTITRAEVVRHGDQVWVEVTADGFLYNMVRAIAGTLIEVGKLARPPDWVGEAVAAKDRRRAGPNAPPAGLFLVRVEYAADAGVPCPSQPRA